MRREAGRLNFVDAALRAFAFLLRVGFIVARRDDTFLRFERENVYVNVYHGRLSYQVSVELGRVRESDVYSLYELLLAVSPADVGQAKLQTTDSEFLERCLAYIAGIIEHRCSALLAGEAAAFEKLRAVAAPIRKAATLQAEFGATIHRADKAWESKDFSQAAALYEKSEAGLDETRVRRLEYLRKHKRK